jgi:hypothetical protein
MAARKGQPTATPDSTSRVGGRPSSALSEEEGQDHRTDGADIGCG